jgi:hypothetical protein
MKFFRFAPTIPALLAIFTTVNAHAAYSMYDEWDQNYNAQALLGAAKYENLTFNFEDGPSGAESDLSLIPQLGGAWTTRPRGDRFQYGLETSFLIGFQLDKVRFASTTNSALYISVSTSMWMFDLAGGPYANLYLDPGRNVRLYAGGGPLMTYASYRAESEFDDGSEDVTTQENAFGIGVYARTGIEFRLARYGMLGLGARGTWANVDFSDVGGRSELVGVAGFVTYTAGF